MNKKEELGKKLDEVLGFCMKRISVLTVLRNYLVAKEGIEIYDMENGNSVIKPDIVALVTEIMDVYASLYSLCKRLKEKI